MAKEVLTRKEVPVELCWDLSLIYASEEAMWKDLDRVVELAKELMDYQGKLTSVDSIGKCLVTYQALLEKYILISNYTSLAVEVDYYDENAKEVMAKSMRTMTKINSDLSFIESEIVQASEEVLSEVEVKYPTVKGYVAEVLRKKPYVLHPEAEKTLAALSEIRELPYSIYNTVKLQDMQFDSFEVDGEVYPLSYSLFEDFYASDPRTEVRRKAFEVFSYKLRQYENVTAEAYNAYVQQDKVMADLRGYKDVFESLLLPTQVNMELYNRQIDLIMDKLAPHMRKYAKLLQRIHKLDKMTYADTKLTIDPEYTPHVSIEDSKEYIVKGLSILGDDIQQMIEEAYDQHWIDFAQNKGKCTGGFCATPYRKNSYILMSWHGRMQDVFTLAHELGHAGHFKLCNEAQSLFDTNTSGYFVESPSTCNELIMAHFMLKLSDNKRFRRWVLSNIVSNTYYHNFVTHLLEAAYQREVYKLVEEGAHISAPLLNKIEKETLEKFWGDAVEINEGSELTWMRQPHYYMGLYSYTYSACLAIATQVVKRLENEGEQAIEDWKKVMSAGGTLGPIEFAKGAGVDITTDAALLDTIEIIGGYIDEIIQLTDELEAEA